MHITGAGSCTIAAALAGDANHDPAPTVSRTFSIAKASQTIAFAALSNKTYGDRDFALRATASSGLPVSFTTSGKCSLSASTVRLKGAGSCTITAAQPGDANHNPAPKVTRSFTIRAALPRPRSSCRVPKVVGMPLRKATARIARAHCRPGRITRQHTTIARKNHVLAQNPKPGKTLKQGARVNLTVGKGPKKK